MRKVIGYIGLGKMGRNMVYNLKDHGWDVLAYNRSPEPRRAVRRKGVRTYASIGEMVDCVAAPRLIWIMVSHKATHAVVREVAKHAKKGDTVIDGGNSHYLESVKNAQFLKKKGIHFLDAGVSGGPMGARKGACCMVGGEKKVFKKYEHAFRDISVINGYAHVGKSGAGHFVKMVHNGIEYGMMQAIGEGFEILKKSKFDFDLQKVSDLYNHESVISSRLVGWLASAYKQHGEDLDAISGRVAHSGEGQWTVEEAKKLKIPAPIIKGSLDFRKRSQKNPSYTGRVVSALRNQFGGHEVRREKKKNKSG